MKIIITGSSGGIGRHLSHLYRMSGHEVWGLSLDADLETPQWTQVDVSSVQAVDGFGRRVSSQWKELDLLICCAGIQWPIGPAMENLMIDWKRNIEVNLLGTFHVIQSVWPLLIKSKGSVVCFSGGGATNKRPNLSAYACAKTAIVRLVETLAQEWLKDGVRINAIAPGPISTAMTEEILKAGPGVAGPKEVNEARAVFDLNATENMEKKTRVWQCIEAIRQNPEITGKLISVPWDNWRTGLLSLSASGVAVLRRTTA